MGAALYRPFAPPAGWKKTNKNRLRGQKDEKIHCILGGMGPLATADLFKKIVLLTKAGCDNDHIRIYIDDNAQIPDRTTAILEGGTDPVPAMTDSVKKLSSIGADVLIMPCNTAHYFLPRLKEISPHPLHQHAGGDRPHLPGEPRRHPGGTAGEPPGTIRSGIYHKALKSRASPASLPTKSSRKC